MTGLIRHLHAFVKEAKLTDGEFEAGWTLMADIAKFTGDERNEFLLFCDVAGSANLSTGSTMRGRNPPWDTPLSAPSTGPRPP